MGKVKNSKLVFSFVTTCLLLVLFNNTSGNLSYAQTAGNCDVSSSFLPQTSQESALLGLINTYRQQNNLSPFSLSSALKKSAAWLSNDMLTHNAFSHTDSLGRDPAKRITDCGYSWTSYAENIAKGSPDAPSVFTVWKNSPPHNAAMLSTTANEAGISFISPYWTLDIGAGSSSPIVNTAPSASPTAPTAPPQVTITPSITEAPKPTPSIITNPTDTVVDVSIRVNGVGATGNKSPKHLTRQVSVDILDQSNKPLVSGNGFLKYDGKDLFRGEIHLGQLARGTYFIKVASNYTLVSQVLPEFQNVTDENTNILPTVNLTQGDLNKNNIVDINDYNLALPCFQSKICQTKNIIDFNDDGKADVIDYNILLSAFHQYEGD